MVIVPTPDSRLREGGGGGVGGGFALVCGKLYEGGHWGRTSHPTPSSTSPFVRVWVFRAWVG